MASPFIIKITHIRNSIIFLIIPFKKCKNQREKKKKKLKEKNSPFCSNGDWNQEGGGDSLAIEEENHRAQSRIQGSLREYKHAGVNHLYDNHNDIRPLVLDGHGARTTKFFPLWRPEDGGRKKESTILLTEGIPAKQQLEKIILK